MHAAYLQVLDHVDDLASAVRVVDQAAYLQVFDHVDDLARAVRVVDQALVSHVAQLTERTDQSSQCLHGNVRSVATQHLNLTVDVRVVNRVTAEDVA